LSILVLLVALLGVAASDVDRNRQTLDRWRADVEHYSRLRRDLRDFYALPADRQAALRTLDRELHALEPAVQRRLYGVMDRYAVWRERLGDEQRQRLDLAPPAERLQLIRELRDQQFLDRQPQAVRDRLKGLTAEQLREAIGQLRKEEHRNVLRRQRQAKQQPPAAPIKPK
jgi:hypothetical protein